jgi:hypothetical protein
MKQINLRRKYPLVRVMEQFGVNWIQVYSDILSICHYSRVKGSIVESMFEGLNETN